MLRQPYFRLSCSLPPCRLATLRTLCIFVRNRPGPHGSDENTEMLNAQNLTGFEHMSEFLTLGAMRSHARAVAVEALNSIDVLSRGAFFVGMRPHHRRPDPT